MNVITTATNLGQAFKNVGRVTEIASVLVRHGFADLLHRMGLTRFLGERKTVSPRLGHLPPAVRLRMSFEELGPTFIKLGQLLATRSDIIPENFTDEFRLLQDKVSSVPFEQVLHIVEAELGGQLGDFFSVFDKTPIAAASIAQVHGAVLKTGEAVAVKVQRPGIDKVIHNDVSILRGIAALLERYIPETIPFNPTGLVEEFFRSIFYELDFQVEANNLRRIRSNIEAFPKIVIPSVYTNLSTQKVLVLERFQGIRFSEREKILAAGNNPSDLVKEGSDAFFSMVMKDGLFHADLHPGNLFVLDDGRIGLIDFGIVGRLSKRVRDSILIIFTALVEEDYETLTYEYLNLCTASGVIDQIALQKDLMDAISPFIGMPLGEINVGKILMRSTAIAARHKLRVPRELMLLFRALMAIEAMGRELDPTFDLMQTGTRLARQVLATRYGKERLFRDMVVVGRDLQSLVETVPRLLRRYLSIWSQNQFVIETHNKGIDQLGFAIDKLARDFLVATLAMIVAAVGITGFIVFPGKTFSGIPVVPSLLCLTAAAVLLLALRFRR